MIMQDYKNSEVKEPLSLDDALVGVAFCFFFYVMIWLVVSFG